jgi:hypothetical protein
MQANLANMAKLTRKLASAGGPQTRWSTDAVKDELRAAFILEIEQTAPEVLVDLRDQVWPHYRKVASPERSFVSPASWPKELRSSVLGWARRHNLVYLDCVPAWVLSQLGYTLGVWTGHPELTQSERLRWCGRGGYSGPSKADHFAIELPQQIERSIYESDIQFEKRVFSALEEIIRPQLQDFSDRIAKLPSVARKRRPEHFTWAVLNQIQRWDFARIAKHFHVAPVSVRNEVTDLKRLIGLRLRPGRPSK